MSLSMVGGNRQGSGLAKRWGWFVALGIALIALGVIAWMDITAATIASTMIVGATLLAGGAFQIIHAFMTRQWRGFVSGLLSGVLYLLGGLLIMNEPVQGALVLTLLLTATVIVGGIVRIVLAWRQRDLWGWGLLLFSGLVSLVIGCLLYTTLPWSGLWVLGALVAVELLVQGGGWLYLGIALRLAA